MKNQVVALPEAKKLDPLLPKDFHTAFRWWRRRHKGEFGKPGYWGKWFVDKSDITIEAEHESFAAPTLPEVLFGLLPKEIVKEDETYIWEMDKDGIVYKGIDRSEILHYPVDDTYVRYIMETINDKISPATAASILSRWLKEGGAHNLK
jgi:hypothetical protein